MDDAKAAAPVLGEAHVNNFHLRAEITQQHILGGMEAQLRSNQVYERRSGLQLNAGEISAVPKIASLEMMLDAQPVIGCLEREVNVLGCFQLENREAGVARDCEHVENAVLAAAIGENLSVDKTRIESGVDARDVVANQGFEPPFGLRAIQRIARLACERMTVRLEFVQQTLERRARGDA